MIWLKLAGLGAVAIVIGLAYWHYQHLVGEAAKVPTLEQTIKDRNATISTMDTDAVALAMRLADSEKRREDADARYSAFERTLNTRFAQLGRDLRATPAAVVPECRPTPFDRRLWNDTLAALAGTDGADADRSPIDLSPPTDPVDGANSAPGL